MSNSEEESSAVCPSVQRIRTTRQSQPRRQSCVGSVLHTSDHAVVFIQNVSPSFVS